MANPWDPDTDVPPELAKKLIQSQFPEMIVQHLEILGIGWDNAAYLINGGTVFRFPRRKMGADLIEREALSLPVIRPNLDLPVPDPIYIGQPEEGYPYPFVGYPKLSGRTACEVPLTELDRAAIATPLATFLRQLHDIPVDVNTARWAPQDDIGRTDLPRRAKMARERLGEIEGEYDFELKLVEELAATPASVGGLRWVHGDLYARHLLVEEQHRLCGVIDWGDVHLGDPALDLSIAYSFLPPAARDEFFAAYGGVDSDTQSRARFRALFYGAILTHYGVNSGDSAIEAVGRYALAHAQL